MNAARLIDDTHAEERLENAEAMLAALTTAQSFGQDLLNEIQMAHLQGVLAIARGVVASCKRKLGISS